MEFKILIITKFPIFQAKSSNAQLIPSLREFKYGFTGAFSIVFTGGLVVRLGLLIADVANITPENSAIVVAIAAPSIPTNNYFHKTQTSCFHRSMK